MNSFATFIRRNPLTWWLVTFAHSLERTAEAGEWDIFANLSKQAGSVVKGVPQARPPALSFDDDNVRDGHLRFTRPADLWCAAVFHLAWMELPDSPLRARSWLFPDEPEYPEWNPYCDFALLGHGDVSGAKAGTVPPGLRSELVHDPFTASTYAIDALLSNAHRAKSGGGTNGEAEPRLRPDSLKDDPAVIALTPIEQAILDVLSEAPMLGADVLAKLARQGIPNVDDSALSRACKREPMKARGVRHRRGAGYFKIPP